MVILISSVMLFMISTALEVHVLYGEVSHAAW